MLQRITRLYKNCTCS